MTSTQTEEFRGAGEDLECPPLDRGPGAAREWSFAERYPGLAYLRRRGFREIAGVEAEYERAVEFASRFVAPKALEIDRRMFLEPEYVPWDVLRAACSYGFFSAPFPRVLGGRGLHPLGTAIALEAIATSCVGIGREVPAGRSAPADLRGHQRDQPDRPGQAADPAPFRLRTVEETALELLRGTVRRWAASRLVPRSAELEAYPLAGRFPPELFGELADLGLFALGAEGTDRLDLEALSEVAFVLAGYEPAVALLVVEQNLAVQLLSAAGRPPAASWMALPLYDHPAVERSWAWGEVAGMAIRSAILGSSLQAASCHAHQRYQGGKILVGHSLVRERLAELELLDEHLRSLWRHLARGEPGTARSKRELVAAALESATRVPRAVSEALQLFGGYGYMEDFGQAKRFRDAHQTAWLFGHAQQKRDSVFETGPERHIDTEARP